jgi:hypothetical protein
MLAWVCCNCCWNQCHKGSAKRLSGWLICCFDGLYLLQQFRHLVSFSNNWRVHYTLLAFCTHSLHCTWRSWRLYGHPRNYVLQLGSFHTRLSQEVINFEIFISTAWKYGELVDKKFYDFEQKWGKDHFSLSICRQKEVVDNLGSANLGDQALFQTTCQEPDGVLAKGKWQWFLQGMVSTTTLSLWFQISKGVDSSLGHSKMSTMSLAS